MKKHSKDSHPILLFLRKLLSPIRNRFPQKLEEHPILSTEEELILLCSKLLGCGEPDVRKYIRDKLSPTKVEKEWVDTIPQRNFKELDIESEEYALWVGFSPKDTKRKRYGEYLYCDSVIVCFFGASQREKFIRVLEKQDNYCKLWKDCYLDIETNQIKITVGTTPPHPELPYHLVFQKRREKEELKAKDNQ